MAVNGCLIAAVQQGSDASMKEETKELLELDTIRQQPFKKSEIDQVNKASQKNSTIIRNGTLVT